MTVIALVGLLAFVALASGQQQYVDYDFQGQGIAPQARPVSSVGLSRAAAAAQIKPTPVPIIKQINKHNDDGSYTYGYEGADGSFKIETKLATGEVTGKYGYVDDTGKLRVVDYGANRYGFQPAGEGITVAPPTLVDETTGRTSENGFAEYDDEGVLFSKPQSQPQPQPQAQQIVRPVPVRQSKRPRPAPQRPVFAAEPQYVTYEPQPRTASPIQLPAPSPVPVQQFQHIPQQAAAQFAQQTPAQFAQVSQQPATQFPQTFITYETQPRAAPAPRVAPAPAPTPARAVVPGAIAQGPLFRPNALPSPIAAAAPAPARPAPVRETPTLRSAPTSGSVLDQLIQQFALPQGAGQPLHDISFGSYSSQTRF